MALGESMRAKNVVGVLSGAAAGVLAAVGTTLLLSITDACAPLYHGHRTSFIGGIRVPPSAFNPSDLACDAFPTAGENAITCLLLLAPFFVAGACAARFVEARSAVRGTLAAALSALLLLLALVIELDPRPTSEEMVLYFSVGLACAAALGWSGGYVVKRFT
jgi:hypothetical protein